MNHPLTPERLAGLGLQSAAATTIRRRPAQPAPTAPEPPSAVSRTARAQIWLVDYLTTAGGSVESPAVKRDGRAAGFAPGVLRMAAASVVRIESVRGAGHRTTWTLVEQEHDATCVTSTRLVQEWMLDHLRRRGGAAASREVKEAAAGAGYRPREIERARGALGVRARTIPGAYPRRTEWSLPSTDGRDPEGVSRSAAAATWLAGFLAGCGGRAESALVKEVGRQFGHHPKALDRARLRRGVRSETVPGSFPRRTVWVLTAP